MIVAPEALPVEAGADVLRNGGNAFDAAVTAAFAQGVVDQDDLSIGGYVLLTMHRPQDGAGSADVIDAPVTAGSKTTPGMWVDRYRAEPRRLGLLPPHKVNDAGYQSICTPGTVRHLATLLARHGGRSRGSGRWSPPRAWPSRGSWSTLRWRARWKTRRRYPEMCSLLDYIMANAEAQRIYLKADGRPYDEGETIRNPDYARTLRHLARHGADDFYHGELAERMSADLAANGAFVTAADLAAYAVARGRAGDGQLPRADARDLAAAARRPDARRDPQHPGGVRPGRDGHNSPEYIYLVAMAMKAAFADRNPHLGDPSIRRRAAGLDDQQGARGRTGAPRSTPAAPIVVSDTPTTAPDTTHVSRGRPRRHLRRPDPLARQLVGRDHAGLGFMYNNSMVNFNPLPGHRNSIAPGKGRTTGMAPTIVYRDGSAGAGGRRSGRQPDHHRRCCR